jgi:glycosyltransferase involved in cell wall biosynthesis
MDPVKGISDLAPILGRLHELGVSAHLTIAGGHDERLLREFNKRMLAHVVTWVGKIPHEECYRLASEHDVFLMCSRKEPFGMVTIEAMSMGCVPMAYDFPAGSREIIEHARSGLLMPMSTPRTWGDEIAALSADRSRLRALSSGAMHRAREHFEAKVVAKKMICVLEEIMGNSANVPARRKPGTLASDPQDLPQHARGYQRLPRRLREWMRYTICRNPRFSSWLLGKV